MAGCIRSIKKKDGTIIQCGYKIYDYINNDGYCYTHYFPAKNQYDKPITNSCYIVSSSSEDECVESNTTDVIFETDSNDIVENYDRYIVKSDNVVSGVNKNGTNILLTTEEQNEISKLSYDYIPDVEFKMCGGNKYYTKKDIIHSVNV